MDGEEMYSPEYEEDMSDAELDAIVAAAEDRLLTAIHDSLDLDAGLAKITGDLPRREADTVATEAPNGGVQTLFASPPVEDQCLRFPQVADIAAREENAVKGAATPPSSSGNRAETMNYFIMVLGDTSIDAFTASGILEANSNVCAVLASTERATIETLDQPGEFRSRFPERVFTAYLKPAPADFAQAREELVPWLTPRPPLPRVRSGAEGALDRADAATRLLLSEDFGAALNAALIWAHAHPIPGIHLAVGVIGFAAAGRMAGSGMLVAAVDLLEKKLVSFAGTADEVWIDLLIGTASIHQHTRKELENARVDSMALIAELGAAVANPAVAGPTGLFGTHLGQILVLGPPEGGGTLRDVHEANASLQLALSAILCGASRRERDVLRFGANRTVNSRQSDAVFAGVGVVEVVFDPALAARVAARRILASMPRLTGLAPGGTETSGANSDSAAMAVQRDADKAARRMLSSISLDVAAPKSYVGTLRSRERLTELAQAAFDKTKFVATEITDSARADIDALRRSELKANPFANDCFGHASRSIRALPGPSTRTASRPPSLVLSTPLSRMPAVAWTATQPGS